MVGVIIAVIVVACLVSYKKVIIWGQKRTGGHEVGVEHQPSGLLVLFLIIGAGMAAPQHATDHWGRIPEQFPWNGEVRINVEGADREEDGDVTVL